MAVLIDVPFYYAPNAYRAGKQTSTFPARRAYCCAYASRHRAAAAPNRAGARWFGGDIAAFRRVCTFRIYCYSARYATLARASSLASSPPSQHFSSRQRVCRVAFMWLPYSANNGAADIENAIAPAARRPALISSCYPPAAYMLYIDLAASRLIVYNNNHGVAAQ